MEQNMTAYQRIQHLTTVLNRYRHEYYNLNAPTVEDQVYDRLFDELAALEKETGIRMGNSPTQTVGYPAVSKLEKTTHAIPLLSLDKTKSSEKLLAFMGEQGVLLMLKLDGLTIKLTYENGVLQEASTRGDGNEGEIVTHNVTGITGIPSHIPFKGRLVVTGEAFIRPSDFAVLQATLVDSNGKPYKNGRNLAAGSVRLLDAKVCKERRINFMAFSVLEGFDNLALKSEHLMQLWSLGFTVEAFEDAIFQQFDFTQLPDFGETLHKNIHAWFQSEENWYTWAELRNFVTIAPPAAPVPIPVPGNPFMGKTVVVTGKVEPYSRTGINAKIEALGARAGSSVSSKTDYLICGENAGSKLEKAQSLGITVLTPAEFFRMIGE